MVETAPFLRPEAFVLKPATTDLCAQASGTLAGFTARGNQGLSVSSITPSVPEDYFLARTTRNEKVPQYSRARNEVRAQGEQQTPEYQAWHSMKRRCFIASLPNYKNYGGRGITVCEEWCLSFTAFLTHVGRRPSPRHSLDRIDVNGNYEPGNVRWATQIEQHSNRRDNRFLTLGDTTKTVAEWARTLGCTPPAIRYRIQSGQSVEQALTSPFNPKFQKKRRHRSNA